MSEFVVPPYEDGARWRRTGRLLADRKLVVISALVVLAITALAAVSVHTVVRDEERRLLVLRMREIAAQTDASTASTRALLGVVGYAAAEDGATSTLFTANAASLTVNGGSVGVAQQHGTSYDVIAARGPHAAQGPLPAQLFATVQRAATAPDLVGALVTMPGLDGVVVARSVSATVPTVAYSLSPLPPGRVVASAPGSPYHELNIAIYASAQPDTAKLLLRSGHDPLTSGSVRESTPLVFGVEHWLIVASPSQPLVGTFAVSFPWLVLGVGIVLAALVAAMINVLARRRDYAMREVDRRTRTLREAQEEAVAANRAKSEFISRMSHELRTPLNAVLGFGQILELYEDLTEEQAEAVRNITRGGRHLLTLINEVLDISQVESGRLALSPEAVDVAAVIRETTTLLAPVAAARSVHLIAPSDADVSGPVFADQQRLTQVLLNLVGNGIKYNRSGGTVTLRCRPVPGGVVRIEVIDTGPGIPAEKLPLLFTPFERLGAERTLVEGTGMGLALSQRLVEAMGGTIGVQSSVGRGSTFWVELPATEDPLNRYERLNGHKPEREEPHYCVLHIEDNLANAKLVEQVLAQRPGVDLIAAMQGSVGLELAREHRPLLVLLDLNLPDLAGEDVLTSLREDPRTARIPVVVVSADATQRQIQRLLSAGASAYLTKPIDVPELLRLVDQAMAAVPSRAGSGAGR